MQHLRSELAQYFSIMFNMLTAAMIDTELFPVQILQNALDYERRNLRQLKGIDNEVFMESSVKNIINKLRFNFAYLT